MKEFWKKLVVAALGLLIMASIVLADDPFDDSGGSGISAAQCFQNGNVQYMAFLRSISWGADGPFKNIKDTWEDVIYRNQCQTADIVNLVNQQDKFKELIRQDFLTCKHDRVERLQRMYYEVTAELYYVRNVVSKNGNMRPDSSLYFEIEDLYGNKLQDMDKFMSEMESKYKQRKEDYVECTNSSWQDVGAKWNEFIETSGGLGPGAAAIAESVTEGAKDIKESALSFENFFDDYYQINLNDQNFETGLDDVQERISELNPASGTPSQSDFLSAVDGVSFTKNIEKMYAEMDAKFKGLYQNAGDESIKVFVDELSGLSDVLKEALPTLQKLEACGENINARQCPSS